MSESVSKSFWFSGRIRGNTSKEAGSNFLVAAALELTCRTWKRFNGPGLSWCQRAGIATVDYEIEVLFGRASRTIIPVVAEAKRPVGEGGACLPRVQIGRRNRNTNISIGFL